MVRLTAADRAYLIRDAGFSFISGKWFYAGEEVADIDKRLLVGGVPGLQGVFRSVRDLQDAKEFFKAAYGTSGRWPPLPIVREAQASLSKKILLPFPLKRQQLLIINRLLFSDDIEKFFIVTGIGGSGKSTFINLIRQLFNNDYTALTLSDLGSDFKKALGVSHRLICSDEINSDELNNADLKVITSGQPLMINPKFEKPYQARFQSAFIFNCNIPPRLDISDSGLMRRIIFYSMNEKIKNPDPSKNKEIFTHEDLLNVAIAALQEDVEGWEKVFEKDTRENLVRYNSVYLLRDKGSYKAYREGCLDKGYKPFSEVKWNEMRDLLKEWGFLDVVPMNEEESAKISLFF